MKSKSALFFVLVSLLAYSVRGAEIPEFTFRHYSVKDGLSSNAVISLVQDRQGLIWMGTADGLNSFDGRNFRQYPLPDKKASCTINCIVEASDGMLWLGTDDGVYSFDGKDFRRIGDYQGVQAPNSIVMSMDEDHDGNIWISTRGQGVFRYTPATGAIANYLSDIESPNIEVVYVDSNNIVWAAPVHGSPALYVLNHAEGVFTPAKMNYKGCGEDRICAIVEDFSGNMWMGTWNSGLYCYDTATKDVAPYVGDGSMKGFSHCHSLSMIAPMTFLIGSDDGLLLYNVASGENRLYVNNADNPKSLSNRFVYPVLPDREGGIWVGTYYGGVDYISSNSGRFQNWSMTEMTGGSEGYTISCFAEDPDGTVWIGSDNGGLMHFDPETGKAIDYITPTHSPEKLSSLNVHAILRDGNYLWVGTYAGGLNRIDLKTGRTKVYTDREGFSDSSMYALAKDASGRLWAATMLGVYVHDSENDRFVRKLRLDVTTTQIVMTKDGRLWMATSGRGLYVYDPSQDLWSNYSSKELGSDQVNYILKTPENKLYIGTKSGLCVMDVDSGKISPVGLEGERNVSFIAAYGNQLWLSTQHGLLRYQPQDGTMEHFTSVDGIESDQFLQGSGLLASDGRIYVGGTSGFVSFYPYRMTRNNYLPPLLISSVRVRNPKRKDSFSEYSEFPLEESMSLSHRHKDVVFEFASLSYCAPEKNTFKCRLDGLDSQWRNLGNQNWIEYTNLPAGRYTFRVMASNNDGVWNEEGISYSFSVRPHPLLSNFALVVYVIIFGVLMYLLIRYMTRRSELRCQKMYDSMLAQRKEEDLDRKVNFVTSIAHEIRTPLSLITAPLERIKSRGTIPAAIESDLSVIDKNSRRLQVLVNQILDFSRINSETLNIRHPEYRSIPLIVRQVTDSFLPTFEARGIEFTYNAPKDDFKADVDEESLNKIVSNLLSNAVKYTGSLVAVTLTRGSGNYTVRVRDNGPGISEEARSKVFTPFFRIDETKQGTGLGLAIVRKLVETSMGSIELREADGGGTEFVVDMPLTSFTAYNAVVESATVLQEEDKTPVSSVKAMDEAADLPVMLVVEDDKDLREFLAEDFSGEYSVLTASDGNEAVSLLGTRNVSIVITDWMMPGMQGDELCKYIRSHKEICHIPSIMLTAKSDDSSALASLNCGADAFVKKPFSVELLHALARHLISLRDMMSKKYSGEPSARNSDIATMSNDSFLSKLSEIIDANIANTELSVAMLANEMCVSRSGLFAKVKESTGDTPNNLIVNARLKAAAKLLDEGKYPINEICYMVGFNSPSYFSRCFGKYFGLTPHQWMTRDK